MIEDDAFRGLVETHQRALRVHCYRLLGSLQDAEDQTQETLLRAWRNRDSFAGRSSLRSWLYRIATNACLDELDRRGRRRLLPSMVGAPSASFGPSGGPVDETPWLEPFPDAWLDVADAEPGPDVRYETKEAIGLAFVATLQNLAPRQRAVLLLRDVLGFSAQDVASLLDMTVAAANSALQRARDRLTGVQPPNESRLHPDAERALVERYVGAWERGDMAAFIGLLKSDAVFSMPPLPEWYVGRTAIAEFFGWATGPAGPGPFRFVPTRANNSPAFGIYAGNGEPLILHVIAAEKDGIASITSFMNPALFTSFGLAPRLASPATPDRR
ncbi:MAG TPA: RNA polymerase subunit sigma-70 [Chloroflexota bacterium]|nr:RNA polymerase subunit sigma-70 [Chloroflexota bacterium]